ncbi:MAG: CHAT domain-containing protein [Acidobacteriota bacterium]
MIRRFGCRRVPLSRLSPILGPRTVALALLQLVLAALEGPALGQAQEKPDTSALARGIPVEREIRGGQSHGYEFNSTAGEYIGISLEQRGVDLVATLIGPDGRPLAEYDDESFTGGREQIDWISETSGNYRLEVSPRSKQASIGRYEVRLDEQRMASLPDRQRLAVQVIYLEARILRRGSSESQQQAAEKYVEVVGRWRALGDRRMESHTLYNLGLTYRVLGDNQKALDAYHQALPLLRSLGERQKEAGTLNGIGTIHSLRDENQKAMPFFNQALILSREVGDRLLEAQVLYNLGKSHSLLGENDKALTYYSPALEIQEALGDREGKAVTLNSTGIAYRLLAEWPKALEYYNQALQLWRSAEDRRREAITLGNMGNIYQEMGEFQKAQDFHSEALALHRATKNRQGEGTVLTAVGWTHWLLGENQKALHYYDQALPITREIADRFLEAMVLNNIGLAQAALGDTQEALNYYRQALTLKRAVEDRWGEGYALLDIGVAHWSLGQYRQALEYYDQALAIKRAVGDRQGEAETLANIGLAYSSMGQHEKALEQYAKALGLQRSIADRKNEATTLLGLARAHRALGDLAAARIHAQAALEIVETLRAQVASHDLRASYLATHRRAYEFYVDILMRLHEAHPNEGYAADGLLASERGRARGLLESLTEAYANIRQGVDPTLLQQERALQQQINAKAARLTELLSGQHTNEQASAAKGEVDSLLATFQQVQARIRLNSPHYAALTQTPVLTMGQIQGQILDAESLLLEYSLGEERSFLWAVTPNSLTSYVLPRRAEIEQVAHQVYDFLTARNQNSSSEKPEKRALRLARAEAEYLEAATALSRILVGPVVTLLADKRLVIVAEGILQYVPFGALPVPESSRPAVSGRHSEKGGGLSPVLIVEHEIVNLPSVSVLAVLRDELKQKAPAPEAVAILADPVFRADDPRIKSDRVGVKRARASDADSNTEGVLDVQRAAAESGMPVFRRLRFSRQEAEAIVALAPPGKSLKAVDFAASRTTATSSEMGRYRVVHIATHSLLNNQHPDLSGVVLSLVDAAGLPQDGFLRLHEIYNLKLGAELVVLSACQTALGREIKGEGLIGLTRGFMYAGSPRVVASLWNVDDRATAELMKRFYAGLMHGGQRPAAALRAAQVSMWKERRWQSPYYWAAFMMQGEWR